MSNTTIPIRNIYYMLSYAYQTLSLGEYQEIGEEKFEDATDLYCAILTNGLPVLIRGGLAHEYQRVTDSSTVLKGKIDLNASIKQNSLVKNQMVIHYDEFSPDILLNQILKATLIALKNSSKVKKMYRKKFFGFLAYFSEVSTVDLNLNLWKKVHYNKQNIRYQFLVDICRYLYEELLLDESKKDHQSPEIIDDQKLSTLFEKFVYALFKKETSFAVTHPMIQWQVDDGVRNALPIMQTDMVLKNGKKTLIVDTKFYAHNLVQRNEFSGFKHHSDNLYQIYAYVNNWPKKGNEEVSGLLLYAKTSAAVQPDHEYPIQGHKIAIKTVDLNQAFGCIQKELLEIVRNYLEF